jgi:FtsP/CotA-like multicopper oxidase with cupredoxin domain
MRFHLAPLALCALALPALGQFNEPPIAVDVNADPNIVEVNLTAAETTWQFINGVDTTVWAYNGTVPGPTIVAEIGQTIRVNFTNDLPEDTTIHWHGVEIPAMMDGSHISQLVVPANGGTFTYEFEALSDQFAWYHPHVRPFDQVEKGLYGGIIIRNPPREATLGFDTIEEHVMFFDDVLLDDQDQIVPAFSFTDPLQNAAYQLNGREGNVLLVNGKEAAQATLTVPNGEPQRWRILNAANTAFCRLDFRHVDGGLDETIWHVGTDGGFNDKPFALLDVEVVSANPDHPNQALINQMGQGVLLLPGERYDVIFTPIGGDGEVFNIWQRDWFRGRHSPTFGTDGSIKIPDDPLDGLYPDQLFLKLVTQGPDPGNGELVPPAKLRNLPPIDRNPANYSKVLPMVFGHGPPNATTGDVTFFAQADFDSAGNPIPYPTAKITSLLAHDVNVGDTALWEITNLTHGDHNFHTHGFFFELIEFQFIDMDTPGNNAIFQPSQRRMLKDVIRVPPRLGAKGRSKTITRLKAVFSDAGREGMVEAGGELPAVDPAGNAVSSGGWLVHCHILEHSAKGMLSFFEVRDPSVTYHYLGSHFPGAMGPTHLTASGTLVGGNPVTFEIVDALPNTTVFLVAGNFEGNVPFRGGNLIPAHSFNGVTKANSPRFTAIFSATTDGNGRATIDVVEWRNALSGITLYWQVAFRDASLAGGWALSNGVSFTRP